MPISLWSLPRNDLESVAAFMSEHRGRVSPSTWDILIRLQDDPRQLGERAKAEGWVVEREERQAP